MQIIERYEVPFADITTSVSQAGSPPAWAAGTTYAAGAEVTRAFRVFVSAVAGNVGIDPLTVNQSAVAAPWILKTWINAARCFDGTMASRTVAPGPVTITLANVGGQDSLMLFGVDAQSVAITGRDTSNAVVYARDINLAAREVDDWYEWFFLPFGEEQTRLALTDLPANVTSLDLVFTGSTVEIGEIFVGRARNMGRTLHAGTTSRVISHTRVDFNAYGEPTVIRGPTRVETAYRVHITKARMAAAFDLLTKLSGQLVGAVGSASRQTTIQVGFLSIDEIPEDLPDDYIVTLTLRGVS